MRPAMKEAIRRGVASKHLLDSITRNTAIGMSTWDVKCICDWTHTLNPWPADALARHDEHVAAHMEQEFTNAI